MKNAGQRPVRLRTCLSQQLQREQPRPGCTVSVICAEMWRLVCHTPDRLGTPPPPPCPGEVSFTGGGGGGHKTGVGVSEKGSHDSSHCFCWRQGRQKEKFCQQWCT